MVGRVGVDVFTKMGLSLSFPGSMVMDDLGGHFIGVCVGRSFRGDIRGDNCVSAVPQKGDTE